MTSAAKISPVNAQKVNYGKFATKQAIANVLSAVINQYKFTSLSQLNAVLKLYNVKADRGSEDSRMFKKGGLTYRVLDETGKPIGTPIKASAFYMKPTLLNLEKKFVANEALKAPHIKRVQTSIGWILKSPPSGIDAFVKALEKENISAVLWKGKAGVVYGITYIDRKTKSVFNGSELGKEYSAKAIVEKCTAELMTKTVEHSISKQATPLPRKSEKESSVLITKQSIEQSLFTGHSATPFIDATPNVFKKKKRKKRRISI